MGSYMCYNSYYNVKLYKIIQKLFKICSVIACDCEVQVFKLYIDNTKNIKYNLLKYDQT